MKFKKLLLVVLFCSISLVPLAVSGYQINIDNPIFSTGNIDTTPTSNQYKVTLEWNSQVDGTQQTQSFYVDDGTTLTLSDLPSNLIADSNGYFSWQEETQGSTKSLNNHEIVINGQDVNLKGTYKAYTNSENAIEVSGDLNSVVVNSFEDNENRSFSQSTLSKTETNYFRETLSGGAYFIGAPDNVIKLVSPSYQSNIELQYMAVSASKNSLSFKNGSYQSVSHVDQTTSENLAIGSSLNIRLTESTSGENGYGAQDSQNKFHPKNADSTIGLSNPEANSSDGGTQSTTPYKNQNSRSNSSAYTYDEVNASYSKNYCANRIVLECDVVYFGSMVIGGQTGYYGDNLDFSQSGAQGYINGTYCELDLNGYDLIMAPGSSLISYGSITDSAKYRNEETGSLVMMSGSTLQSPFVIEDAYLPLSYLVSYFNNSAPFNFYRCPYLDAEVVFCNNSNFDAEYKIDLAGISDPTLGATGIVNILGPEEDNLIQWKDSNEDSKIIRTVSYVDTGNSNQNADMLNQRIHYEVLNSNLAFSYALLPFNLSSLNLSMELDTRKYQFFIPYFFQISLKNSVLKLSQELVFMCGSTLTVDEQSKIVFSYSEILTMSAKKYIVVSLCDEQDYQSVGGLTFMDSFFASEPKTVSISYTYYGSSVMMLTKYSSYYSNLPAAYCDFDGSIEFEENTSQKKQYHQFVLGGNINIGNFDAFSTSVNDWQNKASSSSDLLPIRLYGNYCMTGPNSAKKILISYPAPQYEYIRCYSIVPMISNNYVVADFAQDKSGSTILDTGSSTYDSKTGCVTTKTGTKMAPIPNDTGFVYGNNHDQENIYKAADLNSEDDLAVTFRNVEINSTMHLVNVTDFNHNYIFYRGMFVYTESNSSSTSAEAYLYRFQGHKTDNYGDKFTLGYSSEKWEII